jgi:hypothetical protein
MSILRACLDWRVLIGLAGLGIGIYLVAPGLIAAAIPLLLLAACPLSMLLMMRAMGGQQSGPGPELPAERVGADRAAVLRQELADLGRRQEQVAGDLRAIEELRHDEAEANDATVPAR